MTACERLAVLLPAELIDRFVVPLASVGSHPTDTNRLRSSGTAVGDIDRSVCSLTVAAAAPPGSRVALAAA